MRTGPRKQKRERLVETAYERMVSTNFSAAQAFPQTSVVSWEQCVPLQRLTSDWNSLYSHLVSI